jgi:gluconate kinase
MFNVCPSCGEYTDKKTIDPRGPFAICPFCSHPHPFVQLPLFVLTGASGSGKTAIGLNLATTFPECVTMESDILWGVAPATAEDNYRSYHNTWLRVAKNIGQAGRPVILVGTALPDQLEPCAGRRYFTDLHFLALVCDSDTLAQRLRARPEWRQSGTAAFIDDMIEFNDYLRATASSASSPMAIMDTSSQSVDETTARVIEWVRKRLP